MQDKRIYFHSAKSFCISTERNRPDVANYFMADFFYRIKLKTAAMYMRDMQNEVGAVKCLDQIEESDQDRPEVHALRTIASQMAARRWSRMRRLAESIAARFPGDNTAKQYLQWCQAGPC